MKHWLIGLVLAVVAAILLYISSATAQAGSSASSIALAGSILAVIAIFFVIAWHSNVTPLPSTHRVSAGSAYGAPSYEVRTTPVTPAHNPWAGSGKTLGIMGVGLAGLLFYIFVLVGSKLQFMGWIIYPVVALMFIMLGVVVLLTANREE